jgi:hypothetical protein
VPGRFKSSLNTLKPGRFANESTPGNGGRTFTSQTRIQINRIGGQTGCHTCGIRTPGTKGGNFIPDHQPQIRLSPGPYRLYPHCQGCSWLQGGQVRVQLNLNSH